MVHTIAAPATALLAAATTSLMNFCILDHQHLPMFRALADVDHVWPVLRQASCAERRSGLSPSIVYYKVGFVSRLPFELFWTLSSFAETFGHCFLPSFFELHPRLIALVYSFFSVRSMVAPLSAKYPLLLHKGGVHIRSFLLRLQGFLSTGLFCLPLALSLSCF
jgi:hypothetical protein